MGKCGVSSGFKCGERDRHTTCKLKMRLAMDLSVSKGIYTQSGSENQK